MFQPVGDAAGADHHVFRDRCRLALFAHDAGEEGGDEAADVAAVAQLPLGETFGNVLQQEFLHLRPVLAVVFPDKIQVGFLGKYLYCAAAFEGHFLAMMALDELMPQLVVLQFVYSRFADYLVAEGVVEVARAGNDVLYLVVRREEFARRDGGAGIGRAVALFEPKFVTQNFGAGGALPDVDLAEFLQDFGYFVGALFGTAEGSFLVNAQEVLLRGGIGAHVFYLEFGIHEFGEQGLDAQVGVFVFPDLPCHGGPLLLGSFHLPAEFDVDFVNAPYLAPDVAHGAQGLRHDLLDYGVVQGVLPEAIQVSVYVGGCLPTVGFARFGVAAVDHIAGQPGGQAAGGSDVVQGNAAFLHAAAYFLVALAGQHLIDMPARGGVDGLGRPVAARPHQGKQPLQGLGRIGPVEGGERRGLAESPGKSRFVHSLLAGKGKEGLMEFRRVGYGVEYVPQAFFAPGG